MAALIAEPARALMLDALMDGTARRAGDLALRAGVAPSTASGHLARLVQARLVTVDSAGRERHYRLASQAVAEALESLSRIASPPEVRSLRGADEAEALAVARTCYDHLAGRLGVRLTAALVERAVLVPRDGSYELGPHGEATLVEIGVDLPGAQASRRSFARHCLDWTERRPHLAGALGAALADALLERRWVERRPRDRGLRVTTTGAHELHRLGVDLS